MTIKEKIAKYCAYQERCHQEVRTKLLELKVYGDDLEEIIVFLIQENFLNEERFAREFCRGKFNQKHWGRNKILQELKRRQISEYCINKGLQEIESKDYHKALEDLLKKRLKNKKFSSLFERKGDAARFAISKGYESNLVWETLESLRIV